MYFGSLPFLATSMALFGLSISLKKNRTLYPWVLTLASLLIYCLWDRLLVLVLAADLIISYLFLRLMDSHQTHRKALFLAALVVNLNFLAFFKYSNFFIDSLNYALYSLGLHASTLTVEIIAPLGISFYSFRLISLLIDSYRREILPAKFSQVAAYVSFFPQIASGPITRARDFFRDLDGSSGFTYDQNKVISLLLLGLFKKFVLANYLYQFIGGPFAVPANHTSLDLYLSLFVYACYLYTDFSGYSDIAIAISELLGFRTPANFNSPFRSTNLSEFWQRWHISLSSWLRDYLYLPIGGNDKRYITLKYKNQDWADDRASISGNSSIEGRNLFLTMLIGGFWHGASLNYLIWGGWHGLALIIDHQLKSVWKQFRLVGWFFTVHVVLLSFVFFNTLSITTALDYFRGLTAFRFSAESIYSPLPILLVILIFAGNFLGPALLGRFLKYVKDAPVAVKVTAVAVATLIICLLQPSLVPPFVYFGF